MDEAVYMSDRTFQLWLYTVSHGQMLLRSTKTATEKTRVDLLFKDVHAINLISLLHGLRVTLSGPEAALDLPRGQKFYAISNSRFQGHVIAGSFSHREDEREFHEPSPFDSLSLLKGRPL